MYTVVYIRININPFKMSRKKDKSHELLIINMHSNLKRKVKLQAAENNQTMTGFITSLIERELTTK